MTEKRFRFITRNMDEGKDTSIGSTCCILSTNPHRFKSSQSTKHESKEITNSIYEIGRQVV